MADIGEINSGLEFADRPDPASTHKNWIARKFEDLTIASEISAKGQAMGLEVDDWPGYMLRAAIADRVNAISDDVSILALPEYITLIGTFLFYEAKPIIDRLQLSRRKEPINKKYIETFKNIKLPENYNRK